MVITDSNDMKNLERDETALAMEDIGKERIESLKNSIDELNTMIEDRENLSGEVIDDGEKMKMEISNFLEENKIRNPEDPIEAQERSALRRKKVDICELQMKEKVECWKDIALLKKELREKERELSEKESRLNMLGEILEG